MNDQTLKSPNLVGSFIRQKREGLGLSQRSLGQHLTPPVTTQFISNIERGVTPLPPVHLANLSRSLKVSEEEIIRLLEKEYAAKVSHRVGRPDLIQTDFSRQEDPFLNSLVKAYQQSDDATKTRFKQACESIFQLKHA